MSHTATGEWKSFEIRMQHRRAERLVLRADAAVAAGSLEEARASLEEAFTLWSTAPGLAEAQQRLAEVLRKTEVQKKIDTRTALEAQPVVEPRRTVEAHAAVGEAQRPSRWTERIAAGLSLAFAAGAVALLLVMLGTVQFSSSPAPVLRRPAPLPARDAKSIVEAIPVRDRGAGSADQEAGISAQKTSVPIAGSKDVSTTPDPRPPIPAFHPPVSQLQPSTSDLRSASPDLRSPNSDLQSALPYRRLPTADLRSPVPALPESLIPEVAASTRTAQPVVTAASAPASAQPPQEPLIRIALAGYAKAYTDLDVAAVERVWPSVNRSALARAFDSLALQRVSLGVCSIDVAGDSARASCAGSATWTPKVGGGERRDERAWRFDLEKSASGWLITNARAQNS